MLEIPERQTLTALVAGLYDFTDGGARGRRLLLQQAGLSSFITGIDLTGPADLVAKDILSRIEDHGFLPPPSETKHTLGALLSYLITLPDLPPDKKGLVANLIVKYSLVVDPRYLEKLETDFAITAPAAQPATVVASSAPAVSKASISEPAFAVDPVNEKGLEAIINSEDNFLDVAWLFGALYSAQAVCRIEIPEQTAKGTGFLVGPSLLLTNFHVLKNKDYVADATARFDYKVDITGVSTAGRSFKLDPDVYYSSKAEDLDYALVGVKGRPLEEITVPAQDLTFVDLVLKGKHRGYLVMRPEYIKENDRVNIIQHPDGRPMKAVLTENYVTGDMNDVRVQYVADTMEGSSGSPVFNRKWEVVALHHSGTPYPPDEIGDKLKKAWKGRWRANEGTPMRAILKDFKDKNLERYLPRD
jgi:V8-like Glu-specific endopeptidase